MATATFANHAHALRDAGLAVIPLAPGDDFDSGERAGKKPLAVGFRKWRGKPSYKTIDAWCSKYPDANVGYLAGRSDLVVVDDDGGAEDSIREWFGETRGQIQTRRAAHYLYRKPREDLPKVGDLRKFGINADLKHGNWIAIAPPSIHKSGHVYTWQDCGPEVLKDLPVFPVDQLRRLIDSRAAMSEADKKAAAGFPSGSRRLALNNYLCGHVGWCDTLDEVIDKAQTWNLQQSSLHGIIPLEDVEVMQIAHGAWKDYEAGKLERWHGQTAKVRSDLDEINGLLALGRHGPHAFALLMSLRANHGARCARGENFAITPKAMAAAGTLPGFTREYIEKGRDLLLQAGFIERVSDGQISAKGRTPKLYRLAGFGGHR